MDTQCATPKGNSIILYPLWSNKKRGIIVKNEIKMELTALIEQLNVLNLVRLLDFARALKRIKQ